MTHLEPRDRPGGDESRGPADLSLAWLAADVGTSKSGVPALPGS
ncbi:hypothetical protein [Micromonospora sp. NPDC126480]